MQLRFISRVAVLFSGVTRSIKATGVILGLCNKISVSIIQFVPGSRSLTECNSSRERLSPLVDAVLFILLKH